MHRAFTRTGPFRQVSSPITAMPVTERPVLALDITDMGANDGIDVVIHDVATGHILFETVLSGPESRSLLTSGSPETEVFWRCLQTPDCANHVPYLFLTARCCFSLLNPVIFTKRIARADARNVAFLRLIEEMLDELQTRAPGMSVEVAVTHRNPLFAEFINY